MDNMAEDECDGCQEPRMYLTHNLAAPNPIYGKDSTNMP